jgi:hypothetical protein
MNLATKGQHLILYASGKGKPALAPFGGVSKATGSFLEHMKSFNSTTIDIRRHLEEWDFDLGDISKSMWGATSIYTPFSPIERV